MKTTRHLRWMAGLVIANLVLRGIWLTVMHPPQQFDFLWYYNHALQMAEGQGYIWGGRPTAYWPMGYPWFLSCLFRLTGPSVTFGLVANALLSTGIVAGVYVLTFRLTRCRAWAAAAAVGYTLLPSAVEWNAVLGSEELFTLLLVAALFVYAGTLRTEPNARHLSVSDASRRASGWTTVGMAGILLGLACDVRPIPLLFPALVFLYELCIVRRRVLYAFSRTVVLTLGMALAIAPVTLRNWLVFHHFVLISTNGGVNLWQGTHADGAYFWSWDPRVNPLLAAGSDEVLKDQLGMHAFVAYAVAHPVRLVLHAFAKWFFLYWVDWNVVDVTFAAVWPAHSWLIRTVRGFDTAVYWLWMGVAVLGIAELVRSCRSADDTAAFESAKPGRANFCWPLLYIVYNTAVFAVFPAWDRFRFPLMPLFAVYFGCGWCRQVWPRLAASRIVPRIRRMRKATGTSKAAPPPV